MNAEPLVSVIIPVYNADSYLRQCLDSVIVQTYRNLEIILVDDGSTDGSGGIADEYAQKDSRISVIHKGNGGVSSARNAGLAEARGEYISFVDSDDVIKPDYVSYLYKLLIRYHADVSSCGYIKICRNEKEGKTRRRESAIKMFSGSEALKSMLYKKEITGYSCSKLIKKELIKGEFFDEELKVAEDFDFIFRILKKANDIVYGSRVLYLYYQNPGSCMHDNDWNKYEETWSHLKAKRWEIAVEMPELSAAYDTYLFIGGLGYYSQSTCWKEAGGFKCCLRSDIRQYSEAAATDNEGKRIYRILGKICTRSTGIGCELCRIFIYINNKLKIQLKKAV